MMIGYGKNRYLKRKNCTIDVLLMEDDWYHIPSNLIEIPAKSYARERPDFVGKRVSKKEFMKIMGSNMNADVDTIRAVNFAIVAFHTFITFPASSIAQAL